MNEQEVRRYSDHFENDTDAVRKQVHNGRKTAQSPERPSREHGFPPGYFRAATR